MRGFVHAYIVLYVVQSKNIFGLGVLSLKIYDA